MIRKIAVIGGTGMIGAPVVRALSTRGFQLTLLVRNPGKAAAFNPLPGVTIVEGSIQDRAALAKLLHGNEALYINLNLTNFRKNAFQPEREGLDLILPAARQANIRRVSFISSVVMNYQGMDNFRWWVFDMKADAVSKIRDSGIPHTLFFPSTFMENFQTTYRQGNKILLAGESKQKMYYIAGADYGEQVARSFEVAGDANKAYVIQGREAFTADEAAEIYISNRPQEKLAISRAPLGMLKLLGKVIPKIDYGYHIITALNNYPEKFQAEQTWRELGEPRITLKEFAAR